MLMRAARSIPTVLLTLFSCAAFAVHQPTGTSAASNPQVNFSALDGSSLAFIWHRNLYIANDRSIANGNTPALHQITHNGSALSPSWSPDSRWLLYTYTPPGSASVQAWVVRSDGTHAHRVSGGFWFPNGHTLTVTSGQTITVNPLDSPIRRFHVPFTITSADWSRSGAKLLLAGHPAGAKPYGATRYRNMLYSLGLPGGSLHRLGIMPPVPATTPPPSPTWWPNARGYFYEPDPFSSASIAADGLALHAVALATRRQTVLGALVHDDWMTVQPNQNHVLFVSGAGRGIYSSKQLALCSLPGPCHTIDYRPASVSLDPSWSLDGNQIAFVRASAMRGGFGFTSTSAMLRQINTQTLWVANADGSNPHQITRAGKGIYRPLWAAGAHAILFIRDNAIWTISLTGSSPPRRIVQLLHGHAFPQYPNPLSNLAYYGHITWEALFSWNNGVFGLPLTG
jgi:dipeptidyl aminopeptidase/acylaminoacyl peptidase